MMEKISDTKNEVPKRKSLDDKKNDAKDYLSERCVRIDSGLIKSCGLDMPVAPNSTYLLHENTVTLQNPNSGDISVIPYNDEVKAMLETAGLQRNSSFSGISLSQIDHSIHQLRNTPGNNPEFGSTWQKNVAAAFKRSKMEGETYDDQQKAEDKKYLTPEAFARKYETFEEAIARKNAELPKE